MRLCHGNFYEGRQTQTTLLLVGEEWLDQKALHFICSFGRHIGGKCRLCDYTLGIEAENARSISTSTIVHKAYPAHPLVHDTPWQRR